MEYFRIHVDTTTGQVTFSQSQNIWHSNTGNDDDSATLTLSNANLLQLVQTVTDADGDRDTASINLGTGVFSIEDDGPDALVSNAQADALVLDETRPLGTETDGDSDPVGVASVSANFADNFAAVTDYGSDGPGSTSYSLSLTGANVASGLYALGVGGAQGASIVLNVDTTGTDAGDIVGSAGGVEYFRIHVDTTTGQVTFSQSQNIWHSNTGNDDDSATLTLSNANLLQLVQTVTDADGDRDTASINLGNGRVQHRRRWPGCGGEQCAGRCPGAGRNPSAGHGNRWRQRPGRRGLGVGELCRQLRRGDRLRQRRPGLDQLQPVADRRQRRQRPVRAGRGRGAGRLDRAQRRHHRH